LRSNVSRKNVNIEEMRRLPPGRGRHRRLALAWAAASAFASAPATGRADAAADLIARAQAVERAQAAQLVGHSVEIASRGQLRDGRKVHTLETWRRIDFLDGGRLGFHLVRALFDGQPVGEDELREKITGKKERHANADLVISVLTPLSDPGVTVRYLGPADGGGARLQCLPSQAGGPSGKILSVEVIVDGEGKKRSATPKLGGPDFKHADRAEFQMRFDPDGAPAAYRSFTHGKFLWWEKSLEMAGQRVAQ
jgi:hypothetical protein